MNSGPDIPPDEPHGGGPRPPAGSEPGGHLGGDLPKYVRRFESVGEYTYLLPSDFRIKFRKAPGAT